MKFTFLIFCHPHQNEKTIVIIAHWIYVWWAIIREAKSPYISDIRMRWKDKRLKCQVPGQRLENKIFWLLKTYFEQNVILNVRWCTWFSTNLKKRLDAKLCFNSLLYIHWYWPRNSPGMKLHFCFVCFFCEKPTPKSSMKTKNETDNNFSNSKI